MPAEQFCKLITGWRWGINMTDQTQPIVYYSASTGGFYPSDIHTVFPSDAVVVSHEAYNALMASPLSGKIIKPDANGNPVAVTFTPTADQTHKALMVQAQVALDKSDTTVIRCYSAGVAVPSAWAFYRASLRAIANGSDTSSTSLPSVPSYPAGT